MKKSILIFLFGVSTLNCALAAKQFRESSIEENETIKCVLKNNKNVYAQIAKDVKSIDLDEKVLLAFGKKGGNSNEIDFKGCIDDEKKVSTMSAINNLNLKENFLRIESKIKSVFPTIVLSDLALKTEYCETASGVSIVGENPHSANQTFFWRPESNDKKEIILIKSDTKLSHKDQSELTWDLVSQLLHSKTPGNSYNIRQKQINIIVDSLKDTELKSEFERNEIRELGQMINFPKSEE